MLRKKKQKKRQRDVEVWDGYISDGSRNRQSSSAWPSQQEKKKNNCKIEENQLILGLRQVFVKTWQHHWDFLLCGPLSRSMRVDERLRLDMADLSRLECESSCSVVFVPLCLKSSHISSWLQFCVKKWTRHYKTKSKSISADTQTKIISSF